MEAVVAASSRAAIAPGASFVRGQSDDVISSESSSSADDLSESDDDDAQDDEADGEGVATEGAEIQSTQRTNENGEPVNQEARAGRPRTAPWTTIAGHSGRFSLR